MSKKKLIVFVKNAEAGKVKTRLAASIGDEKALEVYHQLLAHTNLQTKDLPGDKEVWYSRYIQEDDIWDGSIFTKKVQEGEDLGERMANAFKVTLEHQEYEKAVIIGSDCAELTSDIIEQAFDELERSDFVIGPAEDGGYYLLGMKFFHPELFEEIEWSTGSVFQNTMRKMEETDGIVTVLKKLNDVDTINDWNQVKEGLGSKLLKSNSIKG